MEEKFSSDKNPLSDLLQKAESGVLQLPDFQRGWVWDDNHIKSLLASISLSYPIGAVMTLETGNSGVRFAPRLLEGVECDPVEPDMLLLDGQQRMTSLFLALKSKKPVPTRDLRGHRIDRHYYADINKSIDSNIEREEEAIISVPEDRTIKSDFGRTVKLDLSTRDKEIAAGLFPLDIILDGGARMDWMMAYISSRQPNIEKALQTWKQFQTEIIEPFLHYQVPVIKLAKSTTKEAVCQVFEKVNTGGVTLTVFELLTATYAADNFNLREDWKRRSKELRDREILGQLQETEFLQVVTLISTFEKRKRSLASGDFEDKAPAVSCKRREILRLPLEEYSKWADIVMEGLKRAETFLRSECMFRRWDLPYASQLIPLGAIFGVLGEVGDTFQNRQRLSRWYWCGVLGELYGGSTDTRFANDIQDCVAWLEGGDQPRTVRDAQFQAGRLLTLRTRNSAAYKGLYALQMKLGAREFRTGSAIDSDAYADHHIDIHSVFPRAWCASKGIRDDVANCIVNKTAIDVHTSRIIRGSAPSAYLRRIEKEEGMDREILDRILRSHDIDPVTLWRDDFESFFNDRFESLIGQIERIMQKTVNRGAYGDESPFLETPGTGQRDRVTQLISGGETETVEFKSTGLKGLHVGKKEPKVTWAVVKTVCAFLNSNGGTLLVGVGDTGSIVGIEEDFPFLKKPNPDHWSLWLTNLIQHVLNPVATTYLKVRFVGLDGGTVAQIDVKPSVKPVFATHKDRREMFFIRSGASTISLEGNDAFTYQKRRFGTAV